jgi:DGQHR domain-containing protein
MMATEGPIEHTYNCLKVSQPLGDFYIVSMPAADIVRITYFDVRRVMREQRDVERYLGIQRPLRPERVGQIAQYVSTIDAVFPTGIIVAVDYRCALVNEDENKITFKNYIEEENENNNIFYRNIARVLDGQHRLAGLEDAVEAQSISGNFDVNVVVFVGIDIADQANVFATVNLQQTKVNKSLAYDLYDLMKSRSPQRVCHNIAVTLDRDKQSPFFQRIKRLGIATLGRTSETLTQATFIEPLMSLLTKNPMGDRDLYLRGKKPGLLPMAEQVKHPLQVFLVEEMDFDLTDLIWNYFEAIRNRWPQAWDSREGGMMLNRTNGYRALMRFFRPLYLTIAKPGEVVPTKVFYEVFSKINLTDEQFNTDRYPPGTGGETALYRELLDASGITDKNSALLDTQNQTISSKQNTAKR